MVTVAAYSVSFYIVSDDPSLLVLVIDVNRVWWGEKVQQAALSYGDDHVHSEQRNGYKDTATNGAHPHSNNDQVSATKEIHGCPFNLSLT